MAKYKEAIEWVALNDDSCVCPDNEYSYQEAFDIVHSYITTALVSDTFAKDQRKVTEDILKCRGFRK